MVPEGLVETKDMGFDYKANGFGSIEGFSGLEERDGIKDEVCAGGLGVVSEDGIDGVDTAKEVVICAEEWWWLAAISEDWKTESFFFASCIGLQSISSGFL